MFSLTAAAGGSGKSVFLASSPQVALIDVNESAGRTLVEVLGKQFGPERILFLCCDVESEEKIKGFILSSSSHTLRHQHIHVSSWLTELGFYFCNCFFFLRCFSESCRNLWRHGHLLQQCWHRERARVAEMHLHKPCKKVWLPPDFFWRRLSLCCVVDLCYQGELPGSGAHEQAERGPWGGHRQHLIHGWWPQRASILSQNICLRRDLKI